MNDRQIKLLARQLKQQAELMESNTEHDTIISFVATGNALTEAASGFLAGEELTASECERLCSLCYRHSSLSEKIMQDAVQRLNDEKNKEEYHAKAEENKAIREQLQKLENEIASVTNGIHAQKSQLNDAKSKLEPLNEEYSKLQQQLAEYSPEKIAAQEKLNSVLLKQFSDNTSKLKELEESNKGLKDDIDEINQKIDAIPEEKHRLLKEYEEKTTLYSKLVSADTECSEEVQKELEEKIEELQPIVVEKQQAVSSLSSRQEDLENQLQQYKDEQNRFSAEIFRYISDYLSSIKPIVIDEENRIQIIKETADTFTKRVEDCVNTCIKYEKWLSSDTAPLDAMKKMLNRAEAEQLRKTLDIGAIDRIKRLTDDTKNNLKELDAILEKCLAAADIDRKNINKYARR